jgi:hypothetical protein
MPAFLFLLADRTQKTQCATRPQNSQNGRGFQILTEGIPEHHRRNCAAFLVFSVGIDSLKLEQTFQPQLSLAS